MMADIDRVLFTEEQIRARVGELGRQISKDYEGKDLVLVGVLRGANIFLADLCRAITIPATLDFIATSSYGKGAVSTGVVRILKDLEEAVESRHVLLVEDVVDTGLTLQYLMDNLRARNVASLRVCSLLDKPSRRQVPVQVDYLGFQVPDEFLVGYGLDYAQHYRNLPFIGVLKRDIYGG